MCIGAYSVNLHMTFSVFFCSCLVYVCFCVYKHSLAGLTLHTSIFVSPECVGTIAPGPIKCMVFSADWGNGLQCSENKPVLQTVDG